MSTSEADRPSTRTGTFEATPELEAQDLVDAAPEPPIVGVVMGSKSDLAVMREATALLRTFGVPFEARVVSAHRTPDWMAEYARTAEERGIEVIIAGAGGAAHLPGMLAAHAVIPVLGVPVPITALNGLDALMSIVQMPRGVPVGTLAVGAAGAANAALLAVSIVSNKRPELRETLRAWRARRTDEVLAHTTLTEEDERAALASASR